MLEPCNIDINPPEYSLNLNIIFSSTTSIFLLSSAQIEYSTKLQTQSIKPLHTPKWLLPFSSSLPLLLPAAVRAVVSFFPPTLPYLPRPYFKSNTDLGTLWLYIFSTKAALSCKAVQPVRSGGLQGEVCDTNQIRALQPRFFDKELAFRWSLSE